MNATAILLASLFAPPDLSALGSDDWRVREAETQRLDNPLSPLLLPLRHSDPEVDLRVKRLRTKNLKWCNDWYQEQLAYRNDFARWVRDYLLTGAMRYDPAEVLDRIQGDFALAEVLMQLAPPHPECLTFPPDESEWREYLNYHWRVAPMPTEVGK